VVDNRSRRLSNFRGDEAKGIPILQNFQEVNVIHDIFIRVHKMPSRSGTSEKLQRTIPLEFGLPDAYESLDLSGSANDIIHLGFSTVHIPFCRLE